MSTSPPQSMTTLRVLWFAMIMSQVIFVFIVFFVASTHEGDPPKPEEFQAMAIALSAFAFTTVPMALLARSFMMGRATASPDRVPGLYQTCSIIGWALAESITINGFVLAFISMQPKMIIPFFIAGMGCTIVTMPRPQRLKAYVEAALESSGGSSSEGPIDDGPEGDAW